MLKKLIKHEWKSTSKMGGIIMLAIAGMTLVSFLGIALPIGYLGGDIRKADGGLIDVLSIMTMMMSTMLCVFALVGITYGLLIYLGVRFYKTMYSEEGYLTHTLPVTPRQLLLSKTLVAGLWYVLVELGIMLSIFILIVVGIIIPLGGFDNVWWELAQAADMMDGAAYVELIHLIIFMLVAIIITPFSTMMLLFGSITIGQLFNRFKAFMGILVFMGVVFVNSLLAGIVSIPFTVLGGIVGVNTAMGTFILMFGVYDMPVIGVVALAVAFYFISHRILERKLNLE